MQLGKRKVLLRSVPFNFLQCSYTCANINFISMLFSSMPLWTSTKTCKINENETKFELIWGFHIRKMSLVKTYATKKLFHQLLLLYNAVAINFRFHLSRFNAQELWTQPKFQITNEISSKKSYTFMKTY